MGFLGYVVIPPFHCSMILVVSTCNSNGIARVRPLAGLTTEVGLTIILTAEVRTGSNTE